MPELAAEQTRQAGDPRKREDQLGALVASLRSRRQSLDFDWLNFYRAWRGIRSRSQYNSEIFKTFIPSARRAVEKNVIKGTSMLLPSPEFFEVFPGDEYDPSEGKKAESVRAFFVYLFKKRIKIKSFVSQLLRTFYMYGRAISKSGIAIDGFKQVWPTARTVDPFAFYIWPETVPSIDEAQVIAEDHLMPYDVFKGYEAQGRLVNVPSVRELSEPEWPHAVAERLSLSGVSTPSSTGGDTQPRAHESETPPKFMAITEVWYLEDGAWSMCWLLWNCTEGPVIVRRMVPDLGRHPYRMAVARQLPGEQYTTGLMDDLEPLQVLLNDQWDMTLEGQAMGFAPPAIIDPSLMGRSAQFKYAPRAKWFAAIDGVKFADVPDTADTGYKGIAVTQQLIESFSADTPMSNGQPMRGMPRAGFAVSSMLNLAMADIKDACQSLEDDILTPLMSDLYALTVLYTPDEQKFRIPGTREFPTAQSISAQDLAGDYEFQWVGSLQSQDQQVRAQRLIATLGTLGKVAEVAQRDLAGQGKKIGWASLLKRIWRDGLGERGADNIIVDMTPQEMQALNQPPKPQPPRVSVSIKGEIDPVTARDMVDDGQVNGSIAPATTSGAGGADPQAPGSPQQAQKQDARAASEPASG